MDKYPRNTRLLYSCLPCKFIYSPTFFGLSIRPSSDRKHNYISGNLSHGRGLKKDDVTKFVAVS